MANTKLQRTNTAATLGTKCTFSSWWKVGMKQAGGANYLCSGRPSGGGSYINWSITTAGIFSLAGQQVDGGGDIGFTTSRVFQDPASWMHVCLSLDSTLATAFDRIKIYINGELMTSSMYSTSTSIAQNQNWIFTNSGHDFVVGGRTDNSSYSKGSMAQTVLVDGQALAPTAFGAVNSATGIWGTISDDDVRTNVGSFGNNGFFLTYENASYLGYDYKTANRSSNNDLTKSGNGFQSPDNPDNNFTIMDANVSSSYCALDYGGTGTEGNSNSDTGHSSTTFAPTKGKWYAEVQSGTIYGASYPRVGIIHTNNSYYGRQVNGTDGGAGGQGTPNNNEGYACANGQKFTSNALSSFASAWVATDKLAVAMDCDNGAAYVAINNVWQNSGVPTSGSSKTGALVTWTPADVDGTAFASMDYHGTYLSWNFGNGYFATTARTGTNTDSDGEGKFAYAPPTGFKCLNSKQLNTYG